MRFAASLRIVRESCCHFLLPVTSRLVTRSRSQFPIKRRSGRNWSSRRLAPFGGLAFIWRRSDTSPHRSWTNVTRASFLQPSGTAIWASPGFSSDVRRFAIIFIAFRSEEHTSELQSHSDLVCRLLLEKKK